MAGGQAAQRRELSQRGGELRQEFSQRGYVLRPGFLEPAVCAELIGEIRAAHARGGRQSALDRGALSFYSNVFLHSEELRSFVAQPRLLELVTELLGPDVWVRWDQAVAKGPGAPEFPWHQDNGYNRLRDEHLQCWIALTRGTADNGGLWLVPGSHRRLHPHRRIGSHMVYDGPPPEAPVFVPAQPGDLVLFSSKLLHATQPNRSEETRWAYVIEYMSLAHFDPYVAPPYFVVARGGHARPGFVHWTRGRLSPWNQLKYLPPRGRALAGRLLARLRRAAPRPAVRALRRWRGLRRAG